MRISLLLAAALLAVALLVAPGLAPPAVACESCDGLPEVPAMIFNCAVVPAPAIAPTTVITVDLGNIDPVPTVLSAPDHTLIFLDTGATIGISWAFAANASRSAIPSPALPTHEDPTATSPDSPAAVTSSATHVWSPLRR